MWPFDSTPTVQAAPGIFGAPGEEQSLSGFADPGGASAGQNLNIGADSTAPGWSDQLGKALQDLSKSKLAQPPDSTTSYAPTPTAPKASSGEPQNRLSLNTLVQLLQKQQGAYGGLTGQPVTRPQYTGLLGF